MWKAYLPTSRKEINNMEAIIFTTISVLCTAFIWLRVGRQKAFENLLKDYRELAKVVQLQEIIIKGYKQKYGELTDEETKGKN